jgi:DNA polymerase (family 10)
MKTMKMTKDMSNLEVAELLRAISASYELTDPKKNKFRIIAYNRAADAIEHLSSEVKDIWDDGKLEDIPGVGPSISENIGEIFQFGKSKHFEEIMKDFPPAIFELIPLPRIGAKTAFKLVTQLGINSISDLEKKAKDGEISKLEGFGEESQADILEAIKEYKNKKHRLLIPYAEQISNEVIEWMKKDESIVKIDPLGSLRRKASTIGDIDISVASKDTVNTITHFCNYPKAKKIIEKGSRTASILLPNEIQVDLMVQSPESYGALLAHFTGSKHHNIALREFALKKGLSISEYGIKAAGKLNKFPDEDSFYKYLGLNFIPPEMREDSGEIEASLENKIPYLVDVKDIKSDLQIHSDFDTETRLDLGESSMQEIIDKANNLNYEYIAFTEHNPSSSKHSPKEINDIIKRKKEYIDKLNYSYVNSVKGSVKYVFNSLEVDILQDGNLPLDDKALDLLDFALVSIHSSFKMPRDVMTKRIINALSHKKTKIFAHPTTRKLNVREGIEINWPEFFSFCKKNNKWIEIDADPMRLDLPDSLVKDAIKEGILLTLGTDSHHKDSMDNMKYGVSVARRGWATKNDIVNTRGLIEFKKMIK